MIWPAMQSKVTLPTPGYCWPLAMVADQDEASKKEDGWQSHLAYGKLVYNGDSGSASCTSQPRHIA